ncbi:MAG: integration host factor subunit beta [Alphaproteobacteria bacterium]|nr:integration host factor subunit beta [Alphaproteobacteria bacterium]MDA8004850.1 integration host factor subunit beta [Alphaproteobacteria bacterium]MDA8006568.1 integration host factor subunit beta [Alphaproteobacteria bacterium]MDA8013441.1 integration host factor subunit beta [Alphaproteobacteria bacterium]
MNRSELVERLSRRNTRLDEEVLARYVDVVFGEIADALAEGRRVEIRGFGSFWAKDRAERMSRNPRTGEAVHVPAKRVPAFRAGRLLRQRLVDSPGGGGAEAGGEGGGDGAAPEDKKD